MTYICIVGVDIAKIRGQQLQFFDAIVMSTIYTKMIDGITRNPTMNYFEGNHPRAGLQNHLINGTSPVIFGFDISRVNPGQI